MKNILQFREEPLLVMTVGLPASGKSTYAKEIAGATNSEICSSDSVREEVFGDINDQSNNEEVFCILHKRICNLLQNGKNVIYDATNLNSNRRMTFLNSLKNIPCHKICVVFAVPFEECCRRNQQRDRIVPAHALEHMYKQWNTPYYFEGWDSIIVERGSGLLKVNDWVENHMNFSQDNPHHSMTLGEHCLNVAQRLKSDATLYYAGLLHDCGKPFTKQFIDFRGQKTEAAHYYQHHCVGAYNSLLYEYPEEVDVLEVSVLINLHMIPYNWEGNNKQKEKHLLKCKKLWGDILFDKVMKLHLADLDSH